MTTMKSKLKNHEIFFLIYKNLLFFGIVSILFSSLASTPNKWKLISTPTEVYFIFFGQRFFFASSHQRRVEM